MLHLTMLLGGELQAQRCRCRNEATPVYRSSVLLATNHSSESSLDFQTIDLTSYL